MAYRFPLAAATFLATLLTVAAPAPASAADPPTCWNSEVWARPGLTRQYELDCPRTESVEVVSEPRDSRFEGLVQGASLKFRLTPEASAPEHDRFTLRLTGEGGSTDQVIDVHNVPLSVNTPPRCDPVSVAQRTDGAAPVPIEMHVVCWDDEHDDYTLYGGGPGRHPDAPLHNDGGMNSQSEPFWHYVPTIASGQEQTTYYAVDALGARSADAPISVELGPAVDRRPTCRPNPAYSGPEYDPINSRPGATRRFAVICEDPDGDAVAPRLDRAPTRGAFTSFDPGPSSTGWWGTDVWLDITYVPRTTFEGEDRFAIGANSPRGPGPAGEMAIVSRALPANAYAGCGWSPGTTTPGTAVTLTASCYDDDGDPLTAQVSSPPTHGHTETPVVTTGAYGGQDVKVAYQPDPGFTGTDYLSIALSDPTGVAQTIETSVYVGSGYGTAPPVYTIGTPFDWPELHPRPTTATWLPAVGQAAPVSPVDQARRALGKRSVRLLKRIGVARVYSATATPKVAASQNALAVTCPSSCLLTSSSAVAGGSGGHAKRSVAPGKAAVLTLKLSAAQRAHVRRAGRASAVFKLAISRKGAAARRATVRLALRR